MAAIKKPIKKILFYAASIGGVIFAVAAKEKPIVSEDNTLVKLGEKAGKLFVENASNVLAMDAAKACWIVSGGGGGGGDVYSDGFGGDTGDGDDGGDG